MSVTGSSSPRRSPARFCLEGTWRVCPGRIPLSFCHGGRCARIHLKENVKAPASLHGDDLVSDFIHMISDYHLAALIAGSDADACK